MEVVGFRKLVEEHLQRPEAAAAYHHRPEDHFHFFREAMEHLLHAFAHAFVFLHHPHFPPESLRHWLSFCLTVAVPAGLLGLLAYCCCCGGRVDGAPYWHVQPGRPWGGWGRFRRPPGSFWGDPRGYFRNFSFRTKKDPLL